MKEEAATIKVWLDNCILCTLYMQLLCCTDVKRAFSANSFSSLPATEGLLGRYLVQIYSYSIAGVYCQRFVVKSLLPCLPVSKLLTGSAVGARGRVD